jgi:hypothetical protein
MNGGGGASSFGGGGTTTSGGGGGFLISSITFRLDGCTDHIDDLLGKPGHQRVDDEQVKQQDGAEADDASARVILLLSEVHDWDLQ